MKTAIALVILASPCLLGAEAVHPASELIGPWRGTSVCTDRVAAPSCHDETVVYDFTAGAEPGTVHWKADKVVDGKREPMGELDLVYDRGDACWRSEFISPGVHIVWCLTVNDARLKGSAWRLPGKQIVRRVDARPAPYVPPSSYTATTAEAEQRNMPVTAADLRILEAADALLSDPSKWNHHDNRACTPKDTTWSLFCALQRASIDVLGSYDHRRVALQEVRFAIEEAAPAAVFEHRLQDYNNLQTTTFQHIKAVLRVARERVARRLASAPK